MKKIVIVLVLILLLVLTVMPTLAAANDRACWGQASAVFARTGEMGKHASEQETPRVGLRNLARALYEQGVLENDTLQALGAFVAEELGLNIDACL